MNITDSKDVWVAWTNTDCTEGRGQNVPLYTCESESAAKRLGKRGSVQGSDCNVTHEQAVRIDNGPWLAPCKIVAPAPEDRDNDKRLASARKAKAAKEAAIQRAQELGLSEEDIKALRESP